MFKKIIAVLAASVGVCATANAADLGGSYKDAPMASAYVPTWGGLYVGGSVGFGVGDTAGRITGVDFDQPVEVLDKRRGEGGSLDGLSSLLSSEYDVSGAIYGAHIGYNWQRGPVVFGVEAGINGTDIDGSDSQTFAIGFFPVGIQSERELDWYATLVGRLGYASGNSLFYAFGGVAWATVDTTLSVATPFGSGSTSGSSDHVGWTAGVGIEHALTDRFSVRVEYSHVDLGEDTAQLALGSFATINDKVDLSFDAIKIGASYRFGGVDHADALK
jgi:outer membrane immunogenic protein